MVETIEEVESAANGEGLKGVDQEEIEEQTQSDRQKVKVDSTIHFPISSPPLPGVIRIGLPA